jgi:solute carrier family 25 (adenine nucleotide translocator) protein 4/5/6/31
MNVVSGIIGGWASSSILYPFDTLRIHLSNTFGQKINVLSEFKNIIKTKGKKYFYKGFLNSFFGIAVFRGSFFGMYDTLKTKSQNQF